jgi:hypothetical protein
LFAFLFANKEIVPTLHNYFPRSCVKESWFLIDRVWELPGVLFPVCSGGATEDVTTRTQLNHFSVAPLNNGPTAMQQATAAESVALLDTASNQDSQKLKQPSEVSAL